MQKFFLTIGVMVMASPAFATAPNTVPEVNVPEMDGGAGIAAIVLLAGVAAVLREKMKK